MQFNIEFNLSTCYNKDNGRIPPHKATYIDDMDPNRQPQENQRYAEVYGSEENARYSESVGSRENAQYAEFATSAATVKKPVSQRNASRKKKTTTKLVAALLVSAGAAVVTVTTVMVMISVALIGIAVDADSVTATVEIDNPSGIELVATLSNANEYYEKAISSSGTVEVSFDGLSEATEYVFAVRAASSGSAYFSQNVATATKSLYAFDETSDISFHTAELKYIIDESVAGGEFVVEIREHGMDKTLAEYTLDPLTHATFARGLVSDTSYDATLVDASGNGVYTHTFTTAYAPSRITSVTQMPTSIIFEFLTERHDYDSIVVMRNVYDEVAESYDLTEVGVHEVRFDYLDPGETYYFTIMFRYSDPALDSSSELRTYTLPDILELTERNAYFSVYELTRAAYDFYDGNLSFKCIDNMTYSEWLPLIYDREEGTVTVLHEYASPDKTYVIEVLDENPTAGEEEESFVCMIDLGLDTSAYPPVLQPTISYAEVDSTTAYLEVVFDDFTQLTAAQDGAYIYDIAILLYGEVETQLIRDVDLTEYGQPDGDSATFTIPVDNLSETNALYRAEFRRRSSLAGYEDCFYLVAYADFSYNP